MVSASVDIPTGISTQNLFLAVRPSPEECEQIYRRAVLTCRHRNLWGRPISADCLHISLLGFGEYSDHEAALISRVADAIRFPALEITLDRAMSFKNRDRHPFVLTSDEGVEQVRRFYEFLGTRFSDEGSSLRRKPLKPHMTLVWDRKLIDEYEVERPLRWTAREFVLVRSFQGQGRHEIVGRSWRRFSFRFDSSVGVRHELEGGTFRLFWQPLPATRWPILSTPASAPSVRGPGHHVCRHAVSIRLEGGARDFGRPAPVSISQLCSISPGRGAGRSSYNERKRTAWVDADPPIRSILKTLPGQVGAGESDAFSPGGVL
jgi:2'-5' RNA ligase